METNQFNPEVVLEHSDRAAIAATVVSDGYRVIHRLMRSEVDKFVIDLINADPSNGKKVWACHLLAKAAAQFYEGLTARINQEVQQYTGAIRNPGPPVDATEGLIDLGPLSSTFADLDADQFLEEGTFDE